MELRAVFLNQIVPSQIDKISMPSTVRPAKKNAGGLAVVMDHWLRNTGYNKNALGTSIELKVI